MLHRQNNTIINNPKNIASANDSYVINAERNLASKITSKGNYFLESPFDTSLFFTPTDTMKYY